MDKSESSSTQNTVHSIWRNWLSFSGLVLAGAALFAFLFLFVIDQWGPGAGNPYIGILSYVVAPAFLFAGIIIFLVGGWWERRHRRSNLSGRPRRLKIDLGDPKTRWRLLYYGAGAMSFLLLTAIGSYQTYHITETNEFCGLVCHTVMEPEYTTYHEGPHARVACVTCHVGSGAGAYAAAKLNGAHQLLGVITGDYQTPIPTPVRNLRPARETCEQCHWPEVHSGNLEKTYYRYLSDEENTEFTVRLLLHVGGGVDRGTHAGGIHWHTNSDIKIEYYSPDERRQEIPWIRVTKADGTVDEYLDPEFEGEVDKGNLRTMDCIDCHNRPAHRFLSPNDAVDEALHLGRIDRGLTSVKRQVVDLLAGDYASVDEALVAIDAGLRENYPDHDELEAVVTEVQSIYRANFFPAMKSDWLAYPDNSGHKDWAGCLRCHNGYHELVGNPDQLLPANDCNSCHTILAQGSGDDLKSLAPEGIEFAHPGDDVTGWLCNDCHEGRNQEI